MVANGKVITNEKPKSKEKSEVKSEDKKDKK